MRILLPALMMLAAGHAVAANDPLKARQNYERYCAACHGFNGMSVAPDAPNLRQGQGLMQSDQQILQKLKAGSAKKPPMLGLMNDQDLLQVITYARTIR
jgi:cytochrome c553